MPQYHCNNCGNTFKGSEFIDECPECSSDNIQKVDPKAVHFLKRFWPFLILIIALGVASPYLLDLIKGDKDTSDSAVYQMEFQEIDKGIKVEIYRFTMNDKGKLVSEKLSRSTAQDFIKQHELRAVDNREREVLLREGVFYPCPENNMDTLTIKWQKDKEYPLKNNEVTSKVKYFKMEADKPHSKANCKQATKALKITNVNFNPTKCLLQISTNMDNTEKADNVKISINGKSGNFKAQRNWNPKEVDKYNIWAYLKNDTTAYKLNGNPLDDCVDCNESKNDNLRASAVKAGNAYGKEPDNLMKIKKMKKQIDPDQTRFYLNGENMGKWADFYNKMKMQHEDNDLQIKVKSVNTKDCQLTALKFVKR